MKITLAVDASVNWLEKLLQHKGPRKCYQYFQETLWAMSAVKVANGQFSKWTDNPTQRAYKAKSISLLTVYCLEREASKGQESIYIATVIIFKTQAVTVIDWHTDTHPSPNWNLLGGRQSEAALSVTDRMPRGPGKLNSHWEGFN